MRTSQLWACAIVLAGCGDARPAAAPKPVEADTCGSVADHMVEQMLVGKDPRPFEDAIDGIKNRFRARCKEDGWSAAAQACFAKMVTAADADRCGVLLTKAQLEALARDQGVRAGGEPPAAASPDAGAPPD